MPNNRGGILPLCNFIAAPFYYCCRLFSYGQNFCTVPSWWSCRFWRETNINPDNILQLIVKKMEITDLHFKCVQLMIRSIIWRNKGLLLLFRDCLNVTGFYLGKFVKIHALEIILFYYLVHIESILDLFIHLEIIWINYYWPPH